ncbi:hypothetical protein MGH68_13840 [Erysipelothrix sp. D19-032]
MAYKFPKKMTFNTRSLIALEDISREPLGQIMIKMAQGSFKSMIQLLAKQVQVWTLTKLWSLSMPKLKKA